jgi:uncharacterized coiled-coil DUF342 family protein
MGNFKEHVVCSVHRLELVLKRYPARESELKFLKLLRNIPKLSGLCQDKQNTLKKKIDRYASAYVDFNKELVSSTEDLKTRIESRDNGLAKPEKVLEKADEYFQSLSKLFLKLIKAGDGLRKRPAAHKRPAGHERRIRHPRVRAPRRGALSSAYRLNRP